MIKKRLLWVCVISVLVLSMGVNAVGASSTKVSVHFIDSGQSYLVDGSKTPGNYVTFKVNVTDVYDLYGFGIKIKWAGPILDVTSIVEGAFLGSTGETTFFTPKIFNEPDPVGKTDYIILVNTLLAAPFGVTGSGVLAEVTFLVEATGETALYMFEHELYDSSEGLIEHEAEHGYFANESWADKGYPGDVDGDYDVDLEDLMILARAMGTDPTYPSGTGWHEWNSDADLNNDDKVDIFDLILVGTNYGQPLYP